jgi:hypothetical protein
MKTKLEKAIAPMNRVMAELGFKDLGTLSRPNDSC